MTKTRNLVHASFGLPVQPAVADRAMMRRRFLSLFAAAIAFSGPSQAQQSQKIKIGFLTASTLSSITARVIAFQQGLRELGYVEGQNIVIEWRSADDMLERLPSLLLELVRLNVAVIVTAEGTPAIAARNATLTLPIVFAQSGDPVALGLVKSLAHPGGNVTGLTTVAADLAGKQIELLRQVVPQVSRIGVLFNVANPFVDLTLKHAQTTARAINVKLEQFSTREVADISNAFAAMVKARVNGILVQSDPMFLRHRAQIAELALQTRLPAIYGIPEHAEAGGMMAYAASRTDLFRRAASYVDKILKGAKAGDLPVQQPTKFDLIINMKTATVLGIKIPQSILMQATQVIE
jgi:putative ABC transport system substrate-binding protein